MILSATHAGALPVSPSRPAVSGGRAQASEPAAAAVTPPTISDATTALNFLQQARQAILASPAQALVAQAGQLSPFARRLLA